MVLGIFLHAANIYGSDHEWLISSPDKHYLFSFLSDFIHAFRMPAFFMVSGYLLFKLTLSSSGPNAISRVRRIVIPFLSVAFTLNVIQYYLVEGFNSSFDGFENYFSSGRWVSHLWFLVNLLFYNVIGFVVIFLSPVRAIFLRVVEALKTSAMFFAMFFLFMIFYFALLSVNGMFNIYYKPFGLIGFWSFGFYFIFFFMGFVFAANDSVYQRFISSSCALLMTLFFLSVKLIGWFFGLGEFGIFGAVSFYLLSFVSCQWCFVFFSVFLDKKIAIMTMISKSAYTIYLFHHLLVIGFGILLIYFSVNYWLSYPIIIISVFVLTIILHKLGARSFLFLLLFNGISRKEYSSK